MCPSKLVLSDEMRLALLILVLCLAPLTVATAQVSQSSKKEEKTPTEDATKAPDKETPTDLAAEVKKETPPTFINLVGGGRLEVEDIRETADGVWYRRGNMETFLDAKRIARIERPSSGEIKTPTPERLTRSTSWRITDAAKIQKFFLTKFGRPLPTSAFGQSDIHNRWGLDHRQGIDVGLHPDSREGLALQEFLRQERIPFMTFRGPIPGVATGPHIHIGNPSHRYLPR